MRIMEIAFLKGRRGWPMEAGRWLTGLGIGIGAWVFDAVAGEGCGSHAGWRPNKKTVCVCVCVCVC